MNPQRRTQIKKLAAKGWGRSDIATATGATKAEVAKVLGEPQRSEAEPDLVRGAIDMLKRGYDPAVVAANFGETTQ